MREIHAISWRVVVLLAFAIWTVGSCPTLGMAAGGYIDQDVSVEQIPASIRARLPPRHAITKLKMRVLGGDGFVRLTIVRAEGPECEEELCPTFLQAEGLPDDIHVVLAKRAWQADIISEGHYYVGLHTRNGEISFGVRSGSFEAADTTPRK